MSGRTEKSLAEFRPQGERDHNDKSRRQVRRDLFCSDRKRASESECDAAGCKNSNE